MRIIAGSAKGRPILSPKGITTRPTLDRVKESLFNILQPTLMGARVLDLYAGSGNLAFEALSRGASHAICNDHSRTCCEIMRQNIAKLGFENEADVLQMDAMAALRHLQGRQVFDIVFLDPPYQSGADEALKTLFFCELVAEGGRVIVEHDRRLSPLPVTGLFNLADRRKYGDTSISFYERTSKA